VLVGLLLAHQLQQERTRLVCINSHFQGLAEIFPPEPMTTQKNPGGPQTSPPPFWTSKRHDLEMLAPKNQNIGNIWPKCQNMALNSIIMNKIEEKNYTTKNLPLCTRNTPKPEKKECPTTTSSWLLG